MPNDRATPARHRNRMHAASPASDSVEVPPSSYPPPRFEAFALKMTPGTGIRATRKLVRLELGTGWTVRRFGDDPANFEVVGRAGALSVGDAWQATYGLRARAGVLYAEPLFEAAVSGRTDWNDEPSQVDPGAPEAPGAIVADQVFMQIFCGDSPVLPESADPEWSVKMVRAFEAWQSFPPGVVPGEGIVIGHPDTGYRNHPEIANNLLTNLGFDFVGNDPDAQDELDKPSFFQPLLTPGHGTGTASVIISPKGPPPGQQPTPFVTGMAPGAKLIPFRVSRSVVLLSTLTLAQAIERAATAGADVISISMGGLGSWRLQQAIAFAQQRGVIICGAAGNCVHFVVWPAAYDEVIAVAGCTAERQIWGGSSRGSAVDVTAPAESVWCAEASSQNGTVTFNVVHGTGTSYAVATTAGAAALWLAHHGRDRLIQTYGAEKIPVLFNQMLRSTCTPVPGWDPNQFGAGLVNAEALLGAALPNPVMQPLAAPSFFLDDHPPVDRGGEATFAHLFEGTLQAQAATPVGHGAAVAQLPVPGNVLRARLAQLLNIDEAAVTHRLNEVGQELAFHLATNPDLYKRFASSLNAPSTPALAADAGGAEGAMNAGMPRSSALTAVVREALLTNSTSDALRATLSPA